MTKPTAPMPRMGSAKKKTAPKPTTAAATTATPANPKPHTRTAKPSEEERIAKGRRLATSYLEQRDGMEPEVAAMVIDGMEPAEVNALIDEANTAVIEQTKSATTAAPVTISTESIIAPGAAFVAPTNIGPGDEEDDGPVPDYSTIPELVAIEEFAGLVVDVATFARTKNEAEKAYKAGKGALIAILDSNKVGRVEVEGIKLKRYTGHNFTLNAQLLLEAGVDPDVIKRCYKDSPFEDVRVTTPRAKKVEAAGTGTGAGE